MKARLLTAAIGLPLLILAIILPVYVPGTNWIFAAIAGLALAAGLFEFYSLTKKLELKADASMGYLASAALYLGFVFDAPSKAPDVLLLTLAVVIIAIFISQTFRFQKDFTKLATGAGVTVFGSLYVVFLGGFLVALRMGFEGPANFSTKLLGFYFLVIFAADAGAYFAGRALGKHKLAPAISPGKTIEGLIGGIIAAAAASAAATAIFFPELPYAYSIPLGCVLAVLGVVGDLFESALKRGAGAKDAASILPGHGGLLDRLDSLLFGAPVLYFFAKFYFAV